MVPRRTVVRRLLPPRTVPVSTLAPRTVVRRPAPVRVARLRLLSLPLPRRLRLPRSLWQLSLPLRRFSRAQRPVLLIPVPLSPVPLVEMLLPRRVPSSPSPIDNPYRQSL